jgi:hypothetical protein
MSELGRRRPAPVLEVARERRWRGPSTTLGRLRLALAVSWLLAGLLGLVVMIGAYDHRAAVTSIGVDAAPAVQAAHRVKIEIESLDADLINEMLAPDAADTWVKDFAAHRLDIGRQMIAAIRSAYGAEEDAPVEQLEDGLGHYLMAAQEALDAHHRGDPEAALAGYRASFQILQAELVAPASELDRISDASLEAAYRAQQGHAGWIRGLAGALGLASIAWLLVTQRQLQRRVRRVVSPALAGATLVAAGLAGYAVHAFRSHAVDLEGMKRDSYDSVQALLATRADAYEANSAESRWLLDRGAAADHERRFFDQVHKLAAFRDGQTFATAGATADERNRRMGERLRRGEAPVAAGQQVRAELPLDGMDGSLRTALDNVTFPDAEHPEADEPTQSAETLRGFGRYVALDARIRTLETVGQHAEAVRFCLGMAPGDSNWAFLQFDQALGRWIALNERWMVRYRDAALDDVAALPVVAPIGALAIAALVALGLWPRLREYRA